MAVRRFAFVLVALCQLSVVAGAAKRCWRIVNKDAPGKWQDTTSSDWQYTWQVSEIEMYVTDNNMGTANLDDADGGNNPVEFNGGGGDDTRGRIASARPTIPMRGEVDVTGTSDVQVNPKYHTLASRGIAIASSTAGTDSYSETVPWVRDITALNEATVVKDTNEWTKHYPEASMTIDNIDHGMTTFTSYLCFGDALLLILTFTCIYTVHVLLIY